MLAFWLALLRLRRHAGLLGLEVGSRQPTFDTGPRARRLGSVRSRWYDPRLATFSMDECEMRPFIAAILIAALASPAYSQ
jgi:hypothetical protein